VKGEGAPVIGDLQRLLWVSSLEGLTHGCSAPQASYLNAFEREQNVLAAALARLHLGVQLRGTRVVERVTWRVLHDDRDLRVVLGEHVVPVVRLVDSFGCNDAAHVEAQAHRLEIGLLQKAKKHGGSVFFGDVRKALI